MDNHELNAIIASESGTAYNGNDSELAQNHIEAQKYFYNRPRGDETPLKSAVQSSDVMDVIEWMMPDLLEAFLSNENAVEFVAMSEEDRDKAKQETRYINHVFHTDSDGYRTLYDLFKDALLLKVGICKVSRETFNRIESVEYSDLTIEQLGETMKEYSEHTIMDEKIEEKSYDLVGFPPELQEYYSTTPEVQEQQAKIIMEAQEHVQEKIGVISQDLTPEEIGIIQQTIDEYAAPLMQQIQVTLYDVKMRVNIEEEKSTVVAVAPEEFEINQDHTSLNVDNARYTAHRMLLSRSDLIEMGFDKKVVMDLASGSGNADEERYARKYEQTTYDQGSLVDDTMVNVDVRDIYLRVDYDDDGVAELRHIIQAGGEILSNEYADENPFVCISPFPVPHRWVGVSVFDRVKQIQDISTSVWRQQLDNMYRANNNRVQAVADKVNMDDLLNAQPGGVVRVDDLNSLAPLPHVPIANESHAMLERLGRQRMERTGVGPEMMAEGTVVNNHTAHGVERLMTVKEKMIGTIIRNFAEMGIVPIFCKLHTLERKHQNKARALDIGGTFVEFEPWNFTRRDTASIRVGLGTGDKMRSAAALNQIIELQKSLVAGGFEDILVNKEGIYNALVDAASNSGVKNCESYFVDPASPEAQQAIAVQQQQQAMQQQQQQADSGINQQILQLTGKIEGAKLQQKQSDMQHESAIAQYELQLKERDMMLEQMGMDTKNTLDAMKLEQKAEHDADERARKWTKDKDESAQKWSELEAETGVDLNNNGILPG